MNDEKKIKIPQPVRNTNGMEHEDYMQYRGFGKIKKEVLPDGRIKCTQKLNLFQHFMTSEKGEIRENQKALDGWICLGAKPEDMIIEASWII